MEKIIIFDTTLRDGEQAPGASMSSVQKLELAYQLEKLGVDVIEAGFPIASPDDFRAVETIARNIKKSAVCGLARCIRADIEAACNSLKKAKRGRIHLFLATSKIHMQYKFRKAEDEILDLAKKTMRFTRGLCDEIEFSPEDATRTERDFLYRVVEEVIKLGASTVNIPDTVGYSYPQEICSLIEGIRNNVPNINKAVISIHCHNDLGMATANSLSAILAGARQAHCTINGIGERAGNASLEEVVMAMKTRKDIFAGLSTRINTKQIFPISRMVSGFTGFPVPPNKAVVGKNAFRHESGIHQDAVIKKSLTYEIMDPKDVGFSGEQLVMGKHSGRHALSKRLKELGFVLSDSEINEVFAKYKALADKKKEVYDDDLIALVQEETRQGKKAYELVSVRVTTGTDMTPHAELRLTHKKKEFFAGSDGDGPVDACFKAVDKITGLKDRLLDYHIEAVTSGKDALGEAAIKVEVKNKVLSGKGASTDIIEASVKAYLEAINKIM